MLGHLGGIRGYGPGELESTKHYGDVVTPLEMFKDWDLVFDPGTSSKYSTYGYNLLGAAVQKASGLQYVEYVTDFVLKPAGMKVRPDDHFAVIPGRVRGYRRRDQKSLTGEKGQDVEKHQNAALADTSNKIPGGGWLGTAGDMARFMLAFRQCKLTSIKTVDLMLRKQHTNAGSERSYGMGWRIFAASEPGKRIVGHIGSQPGANTYMGMTMNAAWCVAVLTNLEGEHAQTIGPRVIEILRS